MTKRQDAIDSLNEYTRLNDEYNAVMDSTSEPGGGLFTVAEFEELGQLMERLDAARRDYGEKTHIWMESGEG